MRNQLTLTCEATGCERSLGPATLAIAMETPGGRRHAYECDCGAVTITVVRRSTATKTE